jgi:hypothetical protein
MNEQTDLNSKPEAAIQVRVSGDDMHGRRFDETSTAFPTSKGVMLETIHQLREGSTLEITHLLTNRTAIVQVKSLGPKLGVSTLVFVEGGDVEKFWKKIFTKETERNRRDVPGDNASSMMPPDTGTLLAVPERALMHVSKPLLPTMDRFMETLNALVESALEANLRPAVEQLANKIPEHVSKAQTSVFANLDEQIQAALGTFSTRLDDRAREVVTRNENVFTQKIQEVIEQSLLHIKSRQDGFNKNLDNALLTGKGKLSQQMDEVISEGTAKLRDTMQEASGQLQKQFSESCQALTEEKQNALSTNSQQLESDFAQRLSAKVSGIFGETAVALSERAQQVEREFDERLAQRAEGVAAQFHAELQKTFEETLPVYANRLQEQLALSASRFRENFMEQLEDEFNKKQEKLARQAHFLMKDLADQNRNRIAGMLKDLAHSVENQAEPVSATADAAD